MASIEVEIDLEEFSSEELAEELRDRGFVPLLFGEDEETLTQAWIAGRNGNKEKAYALMWGYTLNKLGKVV